MLLLCVMLDSFRDGGRRRLAGKERSFRRREEGEGEGGGRVGGRGAQSRKGKKPSAKREDMP